MPEDKSSPRRLSVICYTDVHVDTDIVRSLREAELGLTVVTGSPPQEDLDNTRDIPKIILPPEETLKKQPAYAYPQNRRSRRRNRKLRKT